MQLKLSSNEVDTALDKLSRSSKSHKWQKYAMEDIGLHRSGRQFYPHRNILIVIPQQEDHDRSGFANAQCCAAEFSIPFCPETRSYYFLTSLHSHELSITTLEADPPRMHCLL
jgi:hypothetical protein